MRTANVTYDDFHSIRVPPMEYYRHVIRGLALAEKKRHAEAAAAFREALKTVPTASRINEALALSLARIGRAEDAIRHYTIALKNSTHPGYVLMRRAELYFHRKQWDKAMQDFTGAIQRDPKRARAWYGRGQVRARTGDAKGAVADFRRCLKLAEPGWDGRADVEAFIATHKEGL